MTEIKADYIVNPPDNQQLFNEEAEMSVLGIMLLDNDNIPQVKDALIPEDFFKKRHRHIYQAIMELYHKEETADLVTVVEKLRKSGKLNEAGGPEYLIGLNDFIPTAAGLIDHIKIVKDNSHLRATRAYLLEATQRLVRDPENLRGELDKIKDLTEAQIRELDRSGQAIPSMRDILLDVEEAIFRRDYKPIPTFSKGLNINLNGGLQRGRVFTIAGPAGGGKTTLAHQILDEIARANRLKAAGEPLDVCLYIHLEQSRAELLIKSYSRLAGINGGDFERQKIEPEDERVKRARETYGKEIAPYLYIVEGGEGLTVREVRALVRKVAAQQTGLYQIILCVDPFQRLRTGDRDLDGDEISRVGAVASGLKILARDLQAAVILLSDTTKDEARKMASGEGTGTGIRGSYMAEHVTDVSAVIRLHKRGDDISTFIDRGDFHKNLDVKCGGHMDGPELKEAVAVYADLFFSKQRSGSSWPVPFLYKKAFNQFVPVEKLTAGE